MNPGDYFTIQGFGYSARGHLVIDGKSVKTKRKMKVARLQTFKAIEHSLPKVEMIPPAILAKPESK